MAGFKLWVMQPFHVDRYRLATDMSPVDVLGWMQGESGSGRFFARIDRHDASQADEPIQFLTRPNINYRNGFMPVINVAVGPATKGSEVHLTFRMHRAVQWFCAIWLVAPTSLSLISLIGLIRGNSPIFGLIPLGMVVFMVLLSGSAYRSERDRTLDFVRRHLETVK